MKQVRRTLIAIFVLVFVGITLGLGYIKVTRGSGIPYADVSTDPLYGDNPLEIVVELPLPPGNVAVSANGRIFFNYHYLGGDGDENGHTVFELVDGMPMPYPSAEFQENFQTTLGMLIDQQNRLWTVDTSAIDDRNTRLIAIDLETNEMVYDYTFETDDADFAQDIQISSDGNTAYLASTGLFGFIPANLIVLDLISGEARILLEGHESVETQNWRITDIDGNGVNIAFGLIDWQAGADGIALTKDDEWLYYAAINHDTMYRIRTEYLLDDRLTDAELETYIETVGTKPLSDGLSMDIEGNVYITDIENGGIARMSPTGDFVTLVSDSRVRWADGISFGPDNTIYFTDSAIPSYLTNTLTPISVEEHQVLAPYYIFRFENDIEGIAGS